MTAPLVSVIIPNFNYGRYLSTSIESVLKQTYSPVEVLVVDDGSSDDSTTVAARYEPRVRLITQRNAGVSAARNRGVAEAKGELLAFLDSDDAWEPSKLAEQVPLFSDPAVGLVHCGSRYCDPFLTPGREARADSTGILRDTFDPGPTAILESTASTIVVRRAVLREVGGFDHELSILADWDAVRKIVCRHSITTARKPLALYRVHASSISRNVRRLEPEVARVLENMFSDPATPPRILGREAQTRARWNLMLSGELLHARDLRRSLLYLSKAVFAWPPAACYAAALPLRALTRRAGPGGR